MRFDLAVAGAGPSGLACARALSGLGRRVALVEVRDVLGGTVRAHPGYLAPAAGTAGLLARLEEDLGPVRVLTGTALEGLAGGPGAFRLRLAGGELEAAALVLATGLELKAVAADHGLAPGPGLLGLSALAGLLADPAAATGRLRGRRVAFFLDRSAPDSRRQHAAALHLAAALRRDLAAEVSWFGRDLKVAGDGLDALYREARDLGVTFFKEGARPLAMTPDGDGLRVRAWVDELPVQVGVDLAVIDEREAPCSPAIDLGPRRASCRLEQRAPRTGIFLAGSVRADLDLEGCLTDGRAAAAAAEAFLRSLDGAVRAEVDAPRCARCLTCVRLCPHRAIAIAYYRETDRAAARVDPNACRGCGLCAAGCPAVAVRLATCTDEDIYRQLGVTA